MKLKRYEGNPILKPKPENDWESQNVFNPAAIYDHGLFHLLYRAMGIDEISRIGYAVSVNGFDFLRLDKPVFTPKLILEPRGCEDPRIVKIGKSYYMTYTAYSERGVRIGIASTDNFLKWVRYRLDWGTRSIVFNRIKDRVRHYDLAADPGMHKPSRDFTEEDSAHLLHRLQAVLAWTSPSGGYLSFLPPEAEALGVPDDSSILPLGIWDGIRWRPAGQ